MTCQTDCMSRHMYTNTHTHIHTHSHTYTHSHSLTHTHTHTHTVTHTRSHTHTVTRTHSHTQEHMLNLCPNVVYVIVRAPICASYSLYSYVPSPPQVWLFGGYLVNIWPIIQLGRHGMIWQYIHIRTYVCT